MEVTTNTNANQNANSLAVIDKNSALGSQIGMLFNNIDFSGLNSAIAEMANSNKDMVPEEKQMAISIVKEWEKGVISRLNQHEADLKAFLGYFNSNSGSYNAYSRGAYGSFDASDEALLEIAAKTGTVKELEASLAARDALAEFKETRPEAPERDPDQSYREKTLAERQYDLELAKYNIDEGKLTRKAALADKAWRKAVMQNEDFKALVKKINAYTRSVTRYTQECKDKGQLAKLNITIGSEAMRQSLRSLLDFVVTI
jgi:hypothetical protein